MGEKPVKPSLEQITDQLEELEVDQQQQSKRNIFDCYSEQEFDCV